MRILYSPLALKTTSIPARQYKRRRWQSAAQAARKQKKWVKRWGFIQVPCIFRMRDCFVAHPSFESEFRRAFPDAKHQEFMLFDLLPGLREDVLRLVEPMIEMERAGEFARRSMLDFGISIKHASSVVGMFYA